MPRPVLCDEVFCAAAVERVPGGCVPFPGKSAGDFFRRERSVPADEGEQLPLQCRGEESVLFRRIFLCHRGDSIRFLREFQRRGTCPAASGRFVLFRGFLALTNRELNFIISEV